MDLVIGIISIFLWSTCPSLVAAQCLDPGWVFYGGSCYLFPTAQGRHEGSRDESQAHCMRLGANLVSISDQAENEFVKKAVSVGCQLPAICADSLWLGLDHPGDRCEECLFNFNCPPCDLSRRRTGWEWLDGSPYMWANWFDVPLFEEPDDGSRCAAMWILPIVLYQGSWADRECDNTYVTVCESPAEIISTSNKMPTTFVFDPTRVDISTSTTISTTFVQYRTTEVTSSSEIVSTSKLDTVTRRTGGISTTTSTRSQTAENVYIGVGAAGGGLLILLAIVVTVICYRKRRQPEQVTIENGVTLDETNGDAYLNPSTDEDKYMKLQKPQGPNPGTARPLPAINLYSREEIVENVKEDGDVYEEIGDPYYIDISAT